jgi:hypothetical protein
MRTWITSERPIRTEAPAAYARACSVTDLYAPPVICDLVDVAYNEFVFAVSTGVPDHYAKGLAALERSASNR